MMYRLESTGTDNAQYIRDRGSKWEKKYLD